MKPLDRLLLYLHTVRYLKPRQLLALALRRTLPVRTVAFSGKPVALRENVTMAAGAPRAPRSFDGTRFTFLNVSKTCDPRHVDWRCSEMSRLWRYNLHYFDYAHAPATSPETASRLITSWIDHNPPGTADAWEPYTVSLRMVNWVRLFLKPPFAGRVELGWLESLYLHALWLEKNLEEHLLGNHLFKNGKALLFAGAFFAGPDAERWLATGERILLAQMAEQVLPDGGHFERSPMYHAMILEDCLDLINLCGSLPPSEIRPLWGPLHLLAAQMVRFLSGMTHPDGEIALFNDAALAVEAAPADLARYHQRLTGAGAPGFPSAAWSFPDTGYYVMAPDAGSRLLVDCGAVGPDYQPGHSHSDTLSFELSLKGRRVIVDSGCCHYVDSALRRYNRGNAGHNTVTLDGLDQSEVWGAHRCARRARPIYATLKEREDGALLFAGAHDGYRRLRGKPVHHRTITWSGATLAIEDRVAGSGRHAVESRLHIHPSLSTRLAAGCAVLSDADGVVATVRAAGDARLRAAEGWYCPGFGVRLRCTVLFTAAPDALLPFTGGWLIERAG